MTTQKYLGVNVATLIIGMVVVGMQASAYMTRSTVIKDYVLLPLGIVLIANVLVAIRPPRDGMDSNVEWPIGTITVLLLLPVFAAVFSSLYMVYYHKETIVTLVLPTELGFSSAKLVRNIRLRK